MSEDEQEPPYQPMPEMGDDTFAGLKADIRENGVEVPVHLDEDGNILDGHNRVAICDEFGIDDYPTTIHTELSEQEKIDIAYTLNLQQRHLDHGQKQDLIEQYLVTDWNGDNSGAWYDDVATTLAVGASTVRRAYTALKEDGKLAHLSIFSTGSKRQRVRDYLATNPDASNRDVAESVAADVSHVTVGNWRGEWESESDGTAPPDEEKEREEDTATRADIFTTTKSDREKATELITDAQNGDEHAAEQVDHLDNGRKTVQTAHTTHRQHTKKQRQIEALENEPPELPDGTYSVLVADPPWQYESDDWGGTHRAGNDGYPKLATEEIAALDVPAAADCVCWLWTTNAFMRDAYRVLDGWGFAPKTILTWVKPRMGLGDWLRNQTEHCILAVRGSPTVDLSNQTTVLEADGREHSRKPDAFYERVEELCPGAKCELFAREERDGWETFGDESDGAFGGETDADDEAPEVDA